jgi:ribulose-5-phosphate 4-epimerase/fuculose-1-phosphate aldolase
MVHAAQVQSRDMKEALRQARVDLSMALRMAVRLGLNEGIDNHFTLMVPGRNDLFLLSPYGLHWTEVTPDALMIVNDKGTRVEGDGFVDPSAFLIHWPIHRARPDAQCVMHTHMPYASALTAIENGRLMMCHQNSLRFFGKVAYDDVYDGLVFDAGQGDNITRALGSADVLFMAHHGVIVVGRTVGEALHRLYFLERACMVQFIAMSAGKPLRIVSDRDAANAVRQFDEWDAAAAEAHFAALKRRLERNDEANW